MAFSRNKRSRLVEAALDMTPLIDVVFLLVIFLLISTTFKKKQLALELNLPRAGKAEYRVSGREHQIRIDTEGGMYLCPNEATKEDTDALGCTAPADSKKLLEEFKQLAEKFPGIRLGVYAGAEVKYKNIARVVAAATEAGLDLNLPYEKDDE
ncbi:MAG: biopolymer transport protein ExbD [Myxococcota bacterium]|jgi:biopolymer transport protein ExbD